MTNCVSGQRLCEDVRCILMWCAGVRETKGRWKSWTDPHSNSRKHVDKASRVMRPKNIGSRVKKKWFFNVSLTLFFFAERSWTRDHLPHLSVSLSLSLSLGESFDFVSLVPANLSISTTSLAEAPRPMPAGFEIPKASAYRNHLCSLLAPSSSSCFLPCVLNHAGPVSLVGILVPYGLFVKGGMAFCWLARPLAQFPVLILGPSLFF